MAMSSSRAVDQAVAQGPISQPVGLWRYGLPGSLAGLRTFLTPYCDGRFRVVDQLTERHLERIRAGFEQSADMFGRTALHHLALDNGDGDAGTRLLLEIGVKPGLGDAVGWTPLHFCALPQRTLNPETTEILWLCRPPMVPILNNAGSVNKEV